MEIIVSQTRDLPKGDKFCLVVSLALKWTHRLKQYAESGCFVLCYNFGLNVANFCCSRYPTVLGQSGGPHCNCRSGLFEGPVWVYCRTVESLAWTRYCRHYLIYPPLDGALFGGVPIPYPFIITSRGGVSPREVLGLGPSAFNLESCIYYIYSIPQAQILKGERLVRYEVAGWL